MEGIKIYIPREWYFDDADEDEDVEVGDLCRTPLGIFEVTRLEQVGNRYKVYGAKLSPEDVARVERAADEAWEAELREIDELMWFEGESLLIERG
jgi:hypothetical protein